MNPLLVVVVLLLINRVLMTAFSAAESTTVAVEAMLFAVMSAAMFAQDAILLGIFGCAITVSGGFTYRRLTARSEADSGK